MSDLPKTIVLELQVYQDNDELILSHEHLKGVLSFKFSSQALAIIQLEAIRLDKSKTPLESVIDDTVTLVDLTSQLREALRELRKNS